jgi:excisionase family DNA binding protein
MRAKRTSSALPPTSGEQGLSPAERSLRAPAGSPVDARAVRRLGDGSPGGVPGPQMHVQDSVLVSAPTSVGGEKRLFYTLKEAAALLHISPATYYRGVREGRFPGRKVGGQWRVPCGALHRYAEGEAAAS